MQFKYQKKSRSLSVLTKANKLTLVKIFLAIYQVVIFNHHMTAPIQNNPNPLDIIFLVEIKFLSYAMARFKLDSGINESVK